MLFLYSQRDERRSSPKGVPGREGQFGGLAGRDGPERKRAKPGLRVCGALHGAEETSSSSVLNEDTEGPREPLVGLTEPV